VTPLPSDSEVRGFFAEMRKLTAYPATGPRICRLEELVVALVARERSVPTDLTEPDGYPSGGGSEIRGGSENTSTEAAALALIDPERPPSDPTGAVIVHLVDFLRQAGQSARIVREDAATAERLSTLSKRPVGQTAEDCQQEGCTNLATHKGNCDACRKWLSRHAEVRVVPREVMDKRHKPKNYVTGPWAGEEEAS
jgi:hypothetical protein